MAESGQRSRLIARVPIRILLVLVVLAVIGVASSAMGIVGTESAQTERPGTPLPDVSWKVTKVSATEVSTGHNTGWELKEFKWGTSFGTPPPREEAKSGAFCAFVIIVGPVFRDPGGGGSTGPGAEESGSVCGPMNPKTGLVKTLPTQGGSLKQPSLGGKTYTWQAFDVGVVAYPQSVRSVRLRFAGGGSAVLRLRRLSAGVRPSSWEPFRYASFGVYGCVDEVEGLSGQRVVARVHQLECGDS